MKKTITTLLLLSASFLSACGETGTAPVETKDNATSGAAVTEVATEAPRYEANVPKKDFGGETFTFYARIYDAGTWSSDDLVVHEQDGELINDAAYTRTAYIEDTYNVKLDTIAAGDSQVLSKLKPLITAGDDTFEAIVCDAYDSASLAASGMLLNLYNVENLDLDAPWWAKTTNDSMSIANTLYYAAGDLTLVDNKATRVFFFNKDIIRDLDLTSPYDYVLSGNWTYDTYFKLSDDAMADLNGDNAYKRGEDRFGTLAQATVGEVLFLAAGGTMTAKDKNGIPYISCDSDKALHILSDIAARLSTAPSVSQNGDSLLGLSYPDNIAYFQNGLGLFAPEVLFHIETMRDCTVDIGIVPPPKFDAAQEMYYCYADGWCVNVVSIPVTNQTPADTAIILEAMSADALNNMTPAYYDICLTSKYVRDETSVAMLDLIFENVVMDNANIFSWGNIESTLNTALTKGDAIASAIEKARKATENAMNKTVTAFSELS